ncbi:MAG: hypothetical protein RIS44_1269 [Pseudomonadota bacterium]
MTRTATWRWPWLATQMVLIASGDNDLLVLHTFEGMTGFIAHHCADVHRVGVRIKPFRLASMLKC